MSQAATSKPKDNPCPTPAHTEANRLLAEVAAAKSSRLRAEADLAAEEERLKELSPFWESLETAYLEELKRETEAIASLKAFETDNKWELFAPPTLAPHSIKTELPGGDLFYSLEEHVVRPRKVDVLANIEEFAELEIYGLGDYQGFARAIKIAKSVDWDLLKTWPQERLLLVGTEKKPKEVFTFELRKES